MHLCLAVEYEVSRIQALLKYIAVCVCAQIESNQVDATQHAYNYYVYVSFGQINTKNPFNVVNFHETISRNQCCVLNREIISVNNLRRELDILILWILSTFSPSGHLSKLASHSQLLSVFQYPWACTFSKDKITFWVVSFPSVSFSNSMQLRKPRGIMLATTYPMWVEPHHTPKRMREKFYFYFLSTFLSQCLLIWFLLCHLLGYSDNGSGGISP